MTSCCSSPLFASLLIPLDLLAGEATEVLKTHVHGTGLRRHCDIMQELAVIGCVNCGRGDLYEAKIGSDEVPHTITPTSIFTLFHGFMLLVPDLDLTTALSDQVMFLGDSVPSVASDFCS